MDMNLLRAIANASAANADYFVDQAGGIPLVQAGYISVDSNKPDPTDPNKRAARITEAGAKAISTASNGATEHTKPISKFAVQTGIELPKVQRGFTKGGAGAPSKYPFDELEIGQFFFVANNEVSKGDALKTLGSAAGSANQRYSEGTGEHETVKRAKRGSDHKAIKGPDGQIVKEEVTVEKKRPLRKFVVRPVKAGVTYGSFTAPADGAVISRVELK